MLGSWVELFGGMGEVLGGWVELLGDGEVLGRRARCWVVGRSVGSRRSVGYRRCVGGTGSRSK